MNIDSGKNRKKTAVLISHYSPEPQYWGMPRYHEWGKRLVEEGYRVFILCASVVHSSDINIVERNKKYCVRTNEKIKYVYVRTSSYKGNGISRIRNLIEFYFGVKDVLKMIPTPEIIISETPNPLGAVAGIQFAKKKHIPHIIDVVDLWPESIVVYQNMSRKNPFIRLLYVGEKWMYVNSNAIIFSMPGGYDYIIERNWQNIIPKEKTYYINNGADVKKNDLYKKKYIYDDELLLKSDIFKVTYTGSVRKVNNIKLLCDAGIEIKNKGINDIVILIHGSGDQVEELKSYCKKERITNVKIYGRIEKKCIPYVLANSDVCVLCYQNTPLLRFGGSMNKMFDYFASGKPIIANAKMGHSIIDKYGCGIELDTNNPKELADIIVDYYKMSKEKIYEIGLNSRRAALDYDVPRLCDKLVEIVREVLPNEVIGDYTNISSTG